MTATTYNQSTTVPTVTAGNTTVSTSGAITTYTTYNTNALSNVAYVTKVNSTPVGVAYGTVASSGTSYVVQAYNTSNTSFKTTTTTTSNASLTGTNWANAVTTMSQVMVDSTGKLYFTPIDTSNTSKYIINNQIATTIRTYNGSSSTNTICNGSTKASCNPVAPTNTTNVVSSSSSSSSAAIGGWQDSPSTVSDAKSRLTDLLSKFRGSSMAFGSSADASGSNNIAYGHDAQAHGNHSNNISFGTAAESDGTNGIAFGANSYSNGVNALAFGASSKAAGERVISLGSGSQTDGVNAVALGAGSSAIGNRVMGLGTGSSASGSDAAALGAGATASGNQALAIGDNAEANGVGVIAIGSGAKALGYNTNGMAIGTSALASGTDVTALGAGSTATGIRATAVGAGATATHTGSTAIGAGATTTAPGQVVLGTTSSSLLIPSLGGAGRFAGSSSQQGQTRVVTTDASGNIGTAFNPKRMEQSIGDIARATQTSAAIAAAFSAVPSMTQLDGEPARCGFGTGGFGSQYAVAGGCAVKISESLFLNGALSYAPSIDYNFGSTPSVAGRLGFSFPLGKISKPTKESAEPSELVIQKLKSQQVEISELRAMVLTLQSQIQELQKNQ